MVVVIGNDGVDGVIPVRLVIDAVIELVVIPDDTVEATLTLSGLIMAGTTREIDFVTFDRCFDIFALILLVAGLVVDDIVDFTLLDVVVIVEEVFEIDDRDIFTFFAHLPCLLARLLVDLLTCIDEEDGAVAVVIEVVADKLIFSVLDTLIVEFDFCFFDDVFFSAVSIDSVDCAVEIVFVLELVILLPTIAIGRLTTGFIICAIISFDVDTSAFCFDSFEVRACKEADFDGLVRLRLLPSSDVERRLRFPRGAGSVAELMF